MITIFNQKTIDTANSQRQKYLKKMTDLYGTTQADFNAKMIDRYGKDSLAIKADFTKRAYQQGRQFLINLKHDPNKQERLENQLCARCQYNLPQVAGQAFATTHCLNCNQKLVFATTDVDKLCPACAKKFNVCKKCAAPI